MPRAHIFPSDEKGAVAPELSSVLQSFFSSAPFLGVGDEKAIRSAPRHICVASQV
jgi:hypothetical protein